MTKPELRLVAELSTAFHFRAAGPQAPACLSEGFFAVTGTPYPPSAGWHWTEAIHPDDRTSFLARWTQADRDRVHLDTEVRLTGGDGHAHWFRIRAAVLPAPDRHGDPSGWVGVGIDVRDQHVLTLERNQAQAFSVQAGKESGMAGQLKAEFLALPDGSMCSSCTRRATCSSGMRWRRSSATCWPRRPSSTVCSRSLS